MNANQPPTNNNVLHIDGIRASGQQGLQEDEATFDPARYLSRLNATPDPFLAPGLEVHRGTQRRWGISSAAEATRTGMTDSEPQSGAQSESTTQPPDDLAQFLGLLESGSGVVGAVSSATNQAQRMMYKVMRSGEMAAALAAMLHIGSPSANIYHALLPEPDQGTSQVSTDELLRILSECTATVFDGRTRLEYTIGHIPGALSVAAKPGSAMSMYVGDVAEIARVLPDRAAPIVVYCNGPFCSKSQRLADELTNAGFTNVRRYQLGTPIWRALVGPMEIEPDGIRYIYEADNTAVFLDARTPQEFALGSLLGSRSVPVDEVIAAKDDGRLPMDDFNTRVVTFGNTGNEALVLALVLARNGFNNVKFYGGTFSSLATAVG